MLPCGLVYVRSPRRSRPAEYPNVTPVNFRERTWWMAIHQVALAAHWPVNTVGTVLRAGRIHGTEERGNSVIEARNERGQT